MTTPNNPRDKEPGGQKNWDDNRGSDATAEPARENIN